ncbi:uncharacterized protein LOC144879639 [Branchiostoma floridae x Branchiostoma japonicum]
MALKLFFVLICSVVSVAWCATSNSTSNATVHVWRGLEQCAYTIAIPKTDPEVCPGGRDTVVFLQDLKATVDDLSLKLENVKVKLGSLEQTIKDDQLNVFSTLTKVLMQEQERRQQIQLLKEEVESLKQSSTTSVVEPESEQVIRPTLPTTDTERIVPSMFSTTEGTGEEELPPTITPLLNDELTERPVTEAFVTDIWWTEYNFTYEDNWNACHGKQYVKLNNHWNIGKYVGVVLCSPTRYKIFLSEKLGDMFRNIADLYGAGEDHCQFLGAYDDATDIDHDVWDSPSTEGYYRGHYGEDLQYGRIGGQGDDWTGRKYPKWYECGVSIP